MIDNHAFPCLAGPPVRGLELDPQAVTSTTIYKRKGFYITFFILVHAFLLLKICRSNLPFGFTLRVDQSWANNLIAVFESINVQLIYFGRRLL